MHESPSDAREYVVRPTPQPGQGRERAHTFIEGAQEPIERRSWWRRMSGGERGRGTIDSGLGIAEALLAVVVGLVEEDRLRRRGEVRSVVGQGVSFVVHRPAQPRPLGPKIS